MRRARRDRYASAQQAARLALAARLVREGLDHKEAARQASVGERQLRKALGVDKRLEGDVQMTDTQRVRRLAARIESEARVQDLDTRHAAGLVWLAEGAEENAYSGQEWAGALSSLQERTLAVPSAAPSVEDPERAVAARAEELAAADRNAPYLQAARAEMIDRGELPLWEEAGPMVRQGSNAAGMAELRRRNLGVALGEEVLPNADTMLIRQHAREQGVSEAQAAVDLYDRGEIR